MRARLATIQKLSLDALKAMKKFFRALWPNEIAPDTVRELAERLRDAQARMIEWRESTARVGADEALCYLLSIYETLELEKVTGVRDNSKWVVDPEHVEKRKKKAQSIIEFANLHEFCPHPNAPAEDAAAAEARARECK